MVIAPARTGSEVTRRIDVTSTDQTNKGILKRVIALGLIFRMVTIILIEPKIEEIPAR